jgi:hypothetical protein
MSRYLCVLIFAISVAPRSRDAKAALPGDTDQALPCRPTIACTADIVPAGTIELEAGVLRRSLPGDGTQWTFPFLLKQSVASWLQLQAGSNGYSLLRGRNIPGQYLDDVTIGSKVRVADQARLRPSLSLSADASIPTFRQAGYVRTYDALVTLYATKDLGPVHVDLNAGFNVWRLDDNPLLQEFVALASSMTIAGPLIGMLEIYDFTDAAPVATRDGGVLVAAGYSVRTWLVFDGGADVAFFHDTRLYSVFAGVTVIPAVLWRAH